MSAVGRCDLGKVRSHNEDSIYISENPETEFEYYIVADGMGGHNAGEIASRSAIQFFNEYIDSNCKINEGADILDAFIDAINYSNLKTFEMSEKDEKLNGMGTTFSAAAVCEDKLYVVHIGDSRVYIYDKYGFRQITRDHSFVMEMVRMGKLTPEEARVHPKRNMITRAVGIEKVMPADTIIQPIAEDSIILLCSDGLPTMVEDKDIEKILRKKIGLDKKADMLVELANKNGGYDNISVILADRRVDN
ncbi:MAG: Stp1/IreP family PP2C-type Ser/Thr phosphatase [Clostridiales bacterium]|nr:Stp1/IreP family PP2C-type Ser/Thr phosphatase [Clostridiales bacterium]